MIKKYTYALAFILSTHGMLEAQASSFFNKFQLPENYQKYLGYFAAAGLGAYLLYVRPWNSEYKKKAEGKTEPKPAPKSTPTGTAGAGYGAWNIGFMNTLTEKFKNLSALRLPTDTTTIKFDRSIIDRKRTKSEEEIIYQCTLMENWKKWNDAGLKILLSYNIIENKDITNEEAKPYALISNFKKEGVAGYSFSDVSFEGNSLIEKAGMILAQQYESGWGSRDENSRYNPLAERNYAYTVPYSNVMFVHDTKNLYAFANWEDSEFLQYSREYPLKAAIFIDKRIADKENLQFLIDGCKERIKKDVAFNLRDNPLAFKNFIENCSYDRTTKLWDFIEWHIFTHGSYDQKVIDTATIDAILTSPEKEYPKEYHFEDASNADETIKKDYEKQTNDIQGRNNSTYVIIKADYQPMSKLQKYLFYSQRDNSDNNSVYFFNPNKTALLLLIPREESSLKTFDNYINKSIKTTSEGFDLFILYKILSHFSKLYESQKGAYYQSAAEAYFSNISAESTSKKLFDNIRAIIAKEKRALLDN